MAVYTMECSGCGFQDTLVIPISKFDERIIEERKKPCPSCSKENSMDNLVGNPTVVYRGDGWTGKIGTGNSQQKLDAALAENDRLQDASKTDALYRKKEDEFKRMEEKAKEEAFKANGAAI